MKKRSLVPDWLFPDVFAITPEFLKQQNIKAVTLDIDNTLVTYGMAEPTEEIIAWVKRLQEEGIFVAIASNNHEPRVKRFNQKLGVFTVWESKKPFSKCVKAVCTQCHMTPSQVAVIGDQIFTDIWCARNAGSPAILVKPIPYPENLFFKCKRFLEKPFIRAYYKKHEEDGKERKNS